MRIVFCGTPDFAVPSLRSLLSTSSFSVEAVVTQPDRPRGRGRNVSASPVKEAALAAGIPVHQPEKIRSDSSYEFFQRTAPDAVVIIAYGQIVPQRLISLPPLGWINLHASLLPKYRGAAPINWAIINGETISGLTTMQIDAGMDTGPILLQREVEIGADETAPQLAVRMSEEGAPLVMDTLRGLESAQIQPQAQNEALASHAPLLKKEHGRIDWALSAREIYNRIRGLAPWPGAYTRFRGQLCHLWGRPAEMAQTEEGLPPGTILPKGDAIEIVCGHPSRLRLEAIQIEGRKRITAREFINGAHPHPGEGFENGNGSGRLQSPTAG
jgi:methionyl-tRNA formyltransferase